MGQFLHSLFFLCAGYKRLPSKPDCGVGVLRDLERPMVEGRAICDYAEPPAKVIDTNLATAGVGA